MRTGWGCDAHRFGGPGPVRLCGVDIAWDRGLVGTSDADVAVHALIDAVLGACGLGDIGMHFPASDERWEGTSSLAMLEAVVGMARAAGYVVGSVDVTIVAQSVRIDAHRQRMRETLAPVLRIEESSVSVKATSTDGLGFTGRDEGIFSAAVAVMTSA